MMTTHTFTVGEERANYITHGIGAIISLAALVILIVFASLYGTAWHIVSFTLFGATMLLLYTASTLVHSFPA
ncbi:hemolysin III family protein, partial [Planococcus sp. SIMBA_143]